MGRGTGQGAGAAHHSGTGKQDHAETQARQLDEQFDPSLSENERVEIKLSIFELDTNIQAVFFFQNASCQRFCFSPASRKNGASAPKLSRRSLNQWNGWCSGRAKSTNSTTR